MIQALKKFGEVDENVAQYGCFAVANLAVNEENSRILCDLNANSVVELCLENGYKAGALKNTT